MKLTELYTYQRDDGGLTMSLTRPPEGTQYTIGYRMEADNGKVIQNRNNTDELHVLIDATQEKRNDYIEQDGVAIAIDLIKDVINKGQKIDMIKVISAIKEVLEADE